MSDAGCVLTRMSTSRRYSNGFTPCASQVLTSVYSAAMLSPASS